MLQRKTSPALIAALVLAGIAVPLSAQDVSAERFITAKQGSKWGLLDQTGAIVLPFIYDSIHINEDGEINLYAEGKSGKADRNGQIYIPVIYSKLGDFDSNGLASARIDGKAGLINRRQEMVFQGPFSSISPFDGKSGYTVRYEGKSGVISLDKTWSIQPDFFYIGQLAKNGLAVAKVNLRQNGFIDAKGKWIIPPHFRRGAGILGGWLGRS